MARVELKFDHAAIAAQRKALREARYPSQKAGVASALRGLKIKVVSASDKLAKEATAEVPATPEKKPTLKSPAAPAVKP